MSFPKKQLISNEVGINNMRYSKGPKQDLLLLSKCENLPVA
jgi:hypothetical protein